MRTSPLIFALALACSPDEVPGSFDEVEVSLGARGLVADDGGAALELGAVSWGRGAAVRDARVGVAQVGRWSSSPEGRGEPVLERALPGALEQFLPMEHGVRHGWTLLERPDGDGPVTIRLDAGAHPVLVGDQGARLYAGARAWSYTGLRAWDADGRPLDAAFRLDAGALVVEVDDAGARWPLSVDPVLATAGVALTGPQSFGLSVALGDLDGDGAPDVLAGAQADAVLDGHAYAWLNDGAGGFAASPDVTWHDVGFHSFGNSVAIGDLDGDGIGDAAVGSLVSVFPGGPGGPSATSVFSHTGGSVRTVGDLDADGDDELVVIHATTDVFLGGPGGPSTAVAASFPLVGAVEGAGDVNGDGHDDLVIGAGNAVHEIRGDSLADVRTFAPDGALEFGAAVDGAGDVDGDGYDDVILADPGQGTAYVYYGSVIGLAGVNTPLVGDPACRFGARVAGVGDVNGDGYDDVAVATMEDCGRVTLFHGGPAGVALVGSTLQGNLGFGAAFAGADLDGDGLSDLAVGDYSAQNLSIFAGCVDGDGDGECADIDCDDADPAISSHAVEVCDGVDNDCDLQFDDADASLDPDSRTTFYADEDGDGWGDAPLDACVAPPDHVAADGDCADDDPAVNPGVGESIGDGQDRDCDGSEICYQDADDDGFRIDGVLFSADADCADPGEALTSDPNLDCNDARADVYPGAPDPAYDGVDNDCGNNDTNDLDGDGVAAVEAGGTDCDDADATIYPGAPELCDGLDQDCDLVPDDDAGSTWFIDADADGYGPSDSAVRACTQPEAGVLLGGDCDDADPDVHPNAAEPAGDERDGDCDGAELCYADIDADGVTSGLIVYSPDLSCGDPGEAPLPAGPVDCDDQRADVYPGAPDPDYDGVDNDCQLDYTEDLDGDGVIAVEAGGTDCDDADVEVYPGAPERCNDVDDDCDLEVDEGVLQDFFPDGDGDGYGRDAEAVLACVNPGGMVSEGGDCADLDPEVHPNTIELAGDERDADCDGSETCYRDDDLDGYGAGLVIRSDDADCDDPGELDAAARRDDCDDTRADAWPGAPDPDYDGIDNDCLFDYTDDLDGDGYDAVEAGGPDCADLDPTRHPGVAEVTGDGIDADCDGGERCFADGDDDGHHAEVEITSADADCDDSGEAGLDVPADDCDDAAADVYAGAPDPDYDGVDNDCADDYTDDLDGDGFDAVQAGGDDCDDAAATVHPGADELNNGLDDDCDGRDEAYDGDADGLTDLIERDLGTDPTLADTDADGLSDGAEVGAGTDPLAADSDGGSVSDGDEVAAGTDPLDPSDDVPPGDTDSDTDTPVEDTGKEASGCGCDSAPTPAGGWALAPLLLGLALRRRIKRV